MASSMLPLSSADPAADVDVTGGVALTVGCGAGAGSPEGRSAGPDVRRISRWNTAGPRRPAVSVKVAPDASPAALLDRKQQTPRATRPALPASTPTAHKLPQPSARPARPP